MIPCEVKSILCDYPSPTVQPTIIIYPLTTNQNKRQTSREPLVASNYRTPALSLTTAEGTITRWKLRENNTFSTKHALLEIKADKAQMDLKALDDSILVTIMVQSGTEAVPVSSQIT